MANVIGGGTGRFLTDTDGDPIGVTDDRLNVNATIGIGSSTFTNSNYLNTWGGSSY